METQPAPRTHRRAGMPAFSIRTRRRPPALAARVADHPPSRHQTADRDSLGRLQVDDYRGCHAAARPIRKIRSRLPRRLGEKSPRLGPLETPPSQRRERRHHPALRHPAGGKQCHRRHRSRNPAHRPARHPKQPPRRRPAQRRRLQSRPTARRRRPETPPPRHPAVPHPRRQQGPPAGSRPSIRHRTHLRHRRRERANPLHHPFLARPPGPHHRPPPRPIRPRAYQGHHHPAQYRNLRLHPLALGKGRQLHPRTLHPRGRWRACRD